MTRKATTTKARPEPKARIDELQRCAECGLFYESARAHSMSLGHPVRPMAAAKEAA
jgi:hypothetical protein